MRRYLLAAAAAVAIASPAAARDGSGYVGIEGGVLFPQDNDADLFADFETTTTGVDGGALPVGVVVPAGPADANFEDAFGIEYKRGIDLDIIGGYDFGMFRLEAELGYKRAKLDEFEIDNTDLAAINAALNLPGDDPLGNPALVATDFDLDGRVSVLSGMINALVDFGNEDGLSFYAGGGAGRARVKFAGDKDTAWAWQLIAGLRYAISPNIDLGLKYRYFRTGNINLADDQGVAVAGNPVLGEGDLDGVVVPIVQTTDATLFTDFEQKFRSHSLLASLIFNFGAPEAAPPPPPPPPPAPVAPPAPATQTCPDGTVILATEVCPAPPPPPPPPPPAPERG